MSDLRFEWDEKKARSNEAKHGVSFAEAATVFWDEHAIKYHDPGHSTSEDRFVMLGLSQKLRLLVVCLCFRQDDDVVRIISAR